MTERALHASSFLPTGFLPPLKTHPSLSNLLRSLSSLQKLYCSTPPPPCDRVTEAKDYQHNESNAEALALSCSDPTEKRYALDWCIKILASDLSWLRENEVDSVLVERVFELASSIIAADAAVDEPGEIERIFRFPLQHYSSSSSSPSGSAPGTPAETLYEIKIRDAPLPISGRQQQHEDEVDDGDLDTSVGGRAATISDHISRRKQDAATAVGVQTWGSAAILSDLLSHAPGEMHAAVSPQGPVLKILELGAGTGLVGMLAARVAQRCLLATERRPDPKSAEAEAEANAEAGNDSGEPRVRATLTDYHELVLANLQENIALNFRLEEKDSSDGIDVECRTLDWSEVDQLLQVPRTSSSARWWHTQRFTYAVILAADVIYSPQHPRWLLSCFQYFLSQNPSSRAHLLCPVRLNGRFGEWNLIEIADDVFRQAGSDTEPKSDILLLERREIPKKKGIGRDDESGYVYWTFGLKAALTA